MIEVKIKNKKPVSFETGSPGGVMRYCNRRGVIY